VHRPGEQFVAAIRIEGNHAISSDALIGGLALRRREDAGWAVDEYQLGQDTTRVIGAYEKLGFFRVDVHARVEHHAEAETVVLSIVEGPRAVTSVEIVGVPADVPAAKARDLVHLVDGGPFDYAAFDAAKEPLLKLVEDAGYAHARLEAGVIADRAHNRATVRYDLDAGPRCTFGEISIGGTSGALRDAVQARLAMHAGEVYSTEALADTQRALYSMGRFSSVRVDVDPAAQGAVVPVRIAVTEGNRHELRAGGGVGMDEINYSVHGRVTYTQVGFPFPMSTVGVDFKPEYTFLRVSCSTFELWKCPSEPRVRLLGTFTQQDFLVPKLRLELEGGLDFLTIEAYTIEGVHTRVGLAMPLWTQRVQARVGWLFGIYGFADINAQVASSVQAELGIDHAEQLGTFNQSLVVDLRDRPVEPHYGGYAELHVAEGTKYAGGAYSYTQWTPELRGYLPVSRAVVALRARLGELVGDVPPTERYYGGGASSDRGYPERQLSPVTPTPAASDSVVIGGAALVEVGAELRVPVGKIKGFPFSGVAFVDGGNVALDASQLDVWRLHWAVGVGTRFFFLPIGPARLDFAYRVGQDSAALPSLSRFQWFLSIGEAF
jgi:outer membrane protein assembly factor BamA